MFEDGSPQLALVEDIIVETQNALQYKQRSRGLDILSRLCLIVLFFMFLNKLCMIDTL